MNFTSVIYALFLPLVLGLYWSLRKRRLQNGLLLLASYVFYGWWDYRFCLLMLASSLVDFYLGRQIERSERPAARRWLLGLSLAANLGMLGVFKYFNFFAENFQSLAAAAGWQVSPLTLKIILPVGISFYTFQTLSYTIDIYRGQLRASRSLLDYLAFVSFFPQLVAGPIERASHLLPQFARDRQFCYDEARQGCRQILWGFFKKVAIADRLAILVDQRYSQPEGLEGPELALATVFFAFQIYCDFSAYSEIAIGTAKLFGIRLMRNFAYPYFSRSLGEFWRRWHISLSTWFRDYVFVPLGGSRTSRARRVLNVVLTFLISGLWHGAAWRFVIWGGINGLAVAGSHAQRRGSGGSGSATGEVAERSGAGGVGGTGGAAAETAVGGERSAVHRDTPGGERLIPRPLTLLRILGTFGIVCVAWIFFRAESLNDAVLILQRIVCDAFSPSGYLAVSELFSEKSLRKTTGILVLMVVAEWLQRRRECPLELGWLPLPLRWTAYTALIWTTIDLVPQSGGEFIYFEF